MEGEIGTIKFYDDKIVTIKGGLMEVWTKCVGDDGIFIVYNETRWKLSKTKEISS